MGSEGWKMHSFYVCIFSNKVGDFDPNSFLNQTPDIKVSETRLDFANWLWKQCPLTCPPSFDDAVYNHPQA